MIDSRIDKKIENDIEISLEEITDTEIMMNFQETLCKLYPHLTPICSYCYDPWDNIVENLYDEMVLKTFCWKYGVSFIETKFHRYAFQIVDFSQSHHIECFVVKDTIKMLVFNKQWDTYSKNYFKNKKIIFKEFSDGIYNLTGSISREEAKNVGFQLVSAFLINQIDEEYDEVFINVKDLTFDLVLENI